MINSLIKRISRLWFSSIFGKIGRIISSERVAYEESLIKDKLKSIGTFSRFGGKVRISGGKNIIIGNNVHIGDNAFLDGRGGLFIGNNTHISRNVTIYSSNHHYDGNSVPYDERLVTKEVFIGENVWIGMDVCITPGTTIEEGAIIGMGSVISKDIKSGEIVVSSQQKVIGQRDMSIYYKNKIEKSYGWRQGMKLEKKQIKKFLESPVRMEETTFVLTTSLKKDECFPNKNKSNKLEYLTNGLFNTVMHRLGLELLTGKTSKEEAAEKIRRYYESTKIIKDFTIFTEVNYNLAPFVNTICEIFANPKFIWIIEDHESFLKSALKLNWFSNENNNLEFFKDRILMNIGLPMNGAVMTAYVEDTEGISKEIWDKLDIRMKALWYWKFWNNLILEEIGLLSSKELFIFKEEVFKAQKFRNSEGIFSDINGYDNEKRTERLNIDEARDFVKEEIEKIDVKLKEIWTIN